MAEINDQQHSLKHLPIAAIMVPFPMQGHLNQVLHLANLIASHNIQVHFVGSILHNQQAKSRLQGWDPGNLNNMTFHDLQLPPISSTHPKLDPSTKFPGHLQSLFDTLEHLREPVFRLLQELSANSRRIIIIHDTLMSSIVQDVKFIPNAEAYALHSVSAFTSFFYIWESIADKPFQLDSDTPTNIPSKEGCFTSEFTDFLAKQFKVLNFDSGRIYNTSRLIEGKYMELLEKLPTNLNKKIFALGPLNPVKIPDDRSGKNRHESVEWLDKQETDSVIYVSFGTATSMTEEQINQLAIGLERSEQKFLWIVRNADGDSVESPRLPQDFEKRVENRGIVVKDWAPQLDVLRHPSIGGFMSHCGWNSCMESISMGVPIAAWPMHSDQPRNSILVTEVLCIGLLVRDWEHRGELVTSETIEDTVRRLMASDEGEVIRKRARELSTAVQGSLSKGGCSSSEMDSFIAHITR